MITFVLSEALVSCFCEAALRLFRKNKILNAAGKAPAVPRKASAVVGICFLGTALMNFDNQQDQ